MPSCKGVSIYFIVALPLASPRYIGLNLLECFLILFTLTEVPKIRLKVYSIQIKQLTAKVMDNKLLMS